MMPTVERVDLTVASGGRYSSENTRTKGILRIILPGAVEGTAMTAQVPTRLPDGSIDPNGWRSVIDPDTGSAWSWSHGGGPSAIELPTFFLRGFWVVRFDLGATQSAARTIQIEDRWVL